MIDWLGQAESVKHCYVKNSLLCSLQRLFAICASAVTLVRRMKTVQWLSLSKISAYGLFEKKRKEKKARTDQNINVKIHNIDNGQKQ